MFLNSAAKILLSYLSPNLSAYLKYQRVINYSADTSYIGDLLMTNYEFQIYYNILNFINFTRYFRLTPFVKS